MLLSKGLSLLFLLGLALAGVPRPDAEPQEQGYQKAQVLSIDVPFPVRGNPENPSGVTKPQTEADTAPSEGSGDEEEPLPEEEAPPEEEKTTAEEENAAEEALTEEELAFDEEFGIPDVEELTCQFEAEGLGPVSITYWKKGNTLNVVDTTPEDLEKPEAQLSSCLNLDEETEDTPEESVNLAGKQNRRKFKNKQRRRNQFKRRNQGGKRKNSQIVGNRNTNRKRPGQKSQGQGTGPNRRNFKARRRSNLLRLMKNTINGPPDSVTLADARELLRLANLYMKAFRSRV